MAARTATILQIIPRLDTGGAELSTIEITEAIVRAGGRALVAAEGGRLSGKIAEAGGELLTFPAGTKNPIRILANTRALGALIRREHIDLVHARSRAPAWSGLMAARRAHVPFVTTYHGAYGETGRLKRLYNSVMARADIVIANSGYTSELIRARYGTPEAKVRVIHRGVDLERYRPEVVAPERVARLRESWSVVGDVPVVLQAARLTGWKGQSVLIEAAGLLKAKGRLGDAVFILAGDAQGRDGYAEGLRSRIRALGLDATVRLVGHVEDIAAAFVAARVTVVASTEPEAFGRTATEAQAMGCPVIATRIGAPPETVLAEPAVDRDAVTGWLVPPGDAAALAEALDAALALSEKDRAALGERAMANVATRFSLEAMKRSTLSVYDALLRTKLRDAFDAATKVRDSGA